MGIHTGTAERRDDDYYGLAVNRAARLMSAAHGGQVLVSHATEEVLRDDSAADIELVDLGEYRLRDLTRAERVFQLVAAGLRRAFPSLRALDNLPTNLPLQITSFVGREEDLATIAKLIDDARLVTLTGPGGVGKTRLAMQVAGEVLPRFAHGAWVAELAAANDPESLVQVLAAALGVVPRPGVSLEGSVREHLRAKQLLLVLDNCEHLLDATGQLAHALLRECGGVRIVATSREPLGIAGEHVWSVGSLPLPEPSSASETIAVFESVRLFIDRARAARSTFVFDQHNAKAVGDICRHLDGLPLAIELAAARVVAMSPTDIAARLDERFRLLAGTRRAGAERHQTLRAAVDWSYELLEPAERIVFARLGVFSGGFDGADAEAVAGDGIDRWDMLDILASLVAKSMVVAEDHPEAGIRYQMLETLRDYALERLDDEESWRRRHAQHYVQFAAEAGRAVTGPDEGRWRHRIHGELDNLRAAVSWALSRDDPDTEIGIRIIAALARESYLDRSAGIGAWADRAASHTAAVSAGLRSAVLAAAAQDALGRDDLETARSFGLQAVDEGFPEDCPAPACAHVALALVYGYSGQLDEALQVIAEASEAMDVADGDLHSRTTLRSRAATLHAWRQDPSARRDGEAAVHLARQLGNPSALADALYAFSWAAVSSQLDSGGTVAQSAGAEAALTALDECIALTRAGASDGVFDGALAQASRIRSAMGEHDRALELLREAVEHSSQIGYRRALIFVMACAVEVLANLGYPEPAAVIAGWDPGRITRITPGPALRAALGAQEFEHATARGDAMSFDEVVAFTLGELERRGRAR
jgi:predicted ATPase